MPFTDHAKLAIEICKGLKVILNFKAMLAIVPIHLINLVLTYEWINNEIPLNTLIQFQQLYCHSKFHNKYMEKFKRCTHALGAPLLSPASHPLHIDIFWGLRIFFSENSYLSHPLYISPYHVILYVIMGCTECRVHRLTKFYNLYIASLLFNKPLILLYRPPQLHRDIQL